jgi:hypothetical protein
MGSCCEQPTVISEKPSESKYNSKTISGDKQFIWKWVGDSNLPSVIKSQLESVINIGRNTIIEHLTTSIYVMFTGETVVLTIRE